MFRFVLALSLCFGLVYPAAAEIPQNRSQITYSFAPLVKQAAPAVVNIFASRKVREAANPVFADPFLRQFFGGNIPGGPMLERVQKSLGSGVIVRADGLIVTNNHVIADADEIHVVLSDRREFPATVVLKDDRADLAMLRIKSDEEKFPFLSLADSDQAEVGDLVLAIGNPFGVGQTVTNGIVSALGRSAEGISNFNEFIQTDASINPGNSGGALLDMNGKLLGINAAIYSRDGGSLGIGFAIPANIVGTIIQAAETGGKPYRPWLGLNGQAVTPDIAASLGMQRPGGLLINNITAGGPAAEAGLHQGDVIISLNGHDVDDTPSLRSRLATVKSGTPVSLTVLRKGQSMEIKATPTVPHETPPRDTTTLKGREPLAGATVENLSPAVTDELSLPNSLGGVIVTAVSNGTLAAQLGVQPGDLIIAINNTKIDLVSQLASFVSKPAAQWHLVIQRGDQTLNVTING